MSRFRGPRRVPVNALRATGKLAVAASRLAAVLGAGVTIAMPFATASTAEAATYSVWACANGSGAPLGVGSWVRSANAGLTDVQTTCGEPTVPAGALFARARALSTAAAGGGGWAAVAAKGTRVSALEVWWSWQTASGGAIRVYGLGNTFLDPIGAPDPFDGKGPCCSDSAFVNLKPGAFGVPTTTSPDVAFGQLNHQSFPKLRGLDGRGIAVVGLAAMCVGPCSSGEPVAQFQAYRIKTVVEDSAPPAGKADGLQDGLRVGPSSSVDVAAADAGGGVRELTLRVDGNVVQRLPAAAGCADVDPSNADALEYNLMQPCPSALTGQLTLTSAQLPDNEPHQVTAVATDAAGQDTVLGSARVALAAPRGFFDPKNGFYNPDLSIAGPPKPNGSHADPSAKLALGFRRGRRTVRRQTVRYSKAARIRGSVRTNRGKPVGRARVWLASRLAGGEWQISRKPLITSRKGVVSARLPARTPSRDVRLLYFPSTDGSLVRSSPSRALRVQATTTIQTDQGGYRNGDTMVLTGRVIRKHLIANKSVYLQAIIRGSWRPFGTTHADSNGRWRLTHRFEAIRRPTIFTFRAVVPSQTGYVWVTGHSRSVRVLATP